MSESVIADFVGNFNSESTTRGEPVKGRVLLSPKRLVLAANDDNKVTIPLSSIFDIAVGHIPPDLGEFFASTVTIAFERNETRYVAAIEAGDEKIDKFSTVLFKTILNGTGMSIKHPARVGGRVTDEKFIPAKLFVHPRQVRFRSGRGDLDIGLSTVTEFDRSARKLRERSRPVLEVRHMKDGQSMMTLAATDSSRKMSILGRYLRREYSELTNELRDIEISDDEKEILVALYSGAGEQGISLAKIVDKEAPKVTMMLNKLDEDDLVVDSSDGTQLTPKGQVVVSKYLEDVNA